jgi:quercetin dioxygenase-like cupin family protein
MLQAGQGAAYWVLGDHITLKLGGEQTGGRCAMAETRCWPGGGPPPHTHKFEDETFYVIDGEFEFILGEETFAASAGYAIHMPKGVIHQFRVVGTQPGRFLVAATPAGFERFAAECGAPFTGQNGPVHPSPEDIQRILAACGKYGISFDLEWHASRKGPPPREHKKLFVLDQEVDLKLTAEQTGGAFCMAEITTRPGSGVSLHRHRDDDEMFYILQGTFEFVLGEARQTLRTGPGSFLHVPRQTYHALSNVGHETGRFLSYHTPGGFEKFLLEADGATPQRTLDLFEKYGSEMAG